VETGVTGPGRTRTRQVEATITESADTTRRWRALALTHLRDYIV
jgi:hypothetical protein